MRLARYGSDSLRSSIAEQGSKQPAEYYVHAIYKLTESFQLSEQCNFDVW